MALYRPGATHAQRDLLYENVGGGQFRDVSERGGPGMQIQRVGRGLAVADYDNDGDLDVIVTNVGEAPVLLRNRGGPGRAWITLRARGRASNRLGLGARVTVQVTAGPSGPTSATQVREITNVSSYLSASDVRLLVGLGDATQVSRVEILWPSGTIQVIENPGVNQILDVEEP